MRIDTQRFGTLQINPDELFLFPQGLIGMESLRQWALLPDLDNPSVAWLQSATPHPTMTAPMGKTRLGPNLSTSPPASGATTP